MVPNLNAKSSNQTDLFSYATQLRTLDEMDDLSLILHKSSYYPSTGNCLEMTATIQVLCPRLWRQRMSHKTSKVHQAITTNVGVNLRIHGCTYASRSSEFQGSGPLGRVATDGFSARYLWVHFVRIRCPGKLLRACSSRMALPKSGVMTMDEVRETFI